MATKNGILEFKVVCESKTTIVASGQQENVTTSLSIEIYTKPNGLGIPAEDYKSIYVPVSEHEPDLKWVAYQVALGTLVIGLTIFVATNPESVPVVIPTMAKLLPATF